MYSTNERKLEDFAARYECLHALRPHCLQEDLPHSRLTFFLTPKERDRNSVSMKYWFVVSNSFNLECSRGIKWIWGASFLFAALSRAKLQHVQCEVWRLLCIASRSGLVNFLSTFPAWLTLLLFSACGMTICCQPIWKMCYRQSRSWYSSSRLPITHLSYRLTTNCHSTCWEEQKSQPRRKRA
jgi:hypothetical protein